MVAVWDATTGQLVRHFPAPDVPQGFLNVTGVAFSGETRIVVATWPSIRIWDINTGDEVLPPVTGHRATLRDVALSPDAKRMASASADRTVKVWDIETGEPLLVLRGHTDGVNDVAFSEDGNWLVSASDDGSIRLYDARPLTRESPIEREALSALEFLFTKPLSKAHAIAYLKQCPAMRPEARKMALDLMDRYREQTKPEPYYDAAWQTIRQRYLNEFQYRFALGQAEHACKLTPDEVRYQVALGAAQYRLGRYEDALTTLTGVAESDDASPSSLAFIALAQHQLGQADQAREALDRLRKIVNQPQWIHETEAQSLLHETEALLAMPKTE